MNKMYEGIQAELNRQRIIEEMKAIRLEEEASNGQNLLSKNLAALGKWMVSRGEKLRKRYESSENGSVDLIKKVA